MRRRPHRLRRRQAAVGGDAMVQNKPAVADERADLRRWSPVASAAITRCWPARALGRVPPVSKVPSPLPAQEAQHAARLDRRERCRHGRRRRSRWRRRSAAKRGAAMSRRVQPCAPRRCGMLSPSSWRTATAGTPPFRAQHASRTRHRGKVDVSTGVSGTPCGLPSRAIEIFGALAGREHGEIAARDQDARAPSSRCASPRTTAPSS